MTTELYAAVEISRRPGKGLIEDVRLFATPQEANWDRDQAAEHQIAVHVQPVALPAPAVAVANAPEAAFVRWLNRHAGKLRLLARVADTVEQAVGEDRYTTARHDLLTQWHALFATMPELYRAFHEWPETADAAARAAGEPPF